MRKIMLFGASGQIGSELALSLKNLGKLFSFTSKELNFFELEKLIIRIKEIRPDIIINAAAYTNVEGAESESEKADYLNNQVLSSIANEAKKLGAVLVHYSTDYVFSGRKKEPYHEGDEAQPLSVYGKSKLGGEQQIINSGCKFLILRTSWVYSDHHPNFIHKIIQLAQTKPELEVIHDQIGSPTYAPFIAKITNLLLQQILQNDDNYGLYHLSEGGVASWYDLAQFVLNYLALKKLIKNPKLIKINSSEYPAKAKRPLYSKLDASKLEKFCGINFLPWQDNVKLMLDKMDLPAAK